MSLKNEQEINTGFTGFTVSGPNGETAITPQHPSTGSKRKLVVEAGDGSLGLTHLPKVFDKKSTMY